jgi:tetratricopeptide (TPR) repeat protein
MVDKGYAPLLDPQAALDAPPLPQNHPYYDTKVKWLMGLCVTGMVAGFGLIPAALYFAQREYFLYLQPILFDNTLSAVLTVFPAIFFSCFLFGLLSMWIQRTNERFTTYSAYNLIINANRYVQGLMFEKVPFERLITKEQVKKVIQYQDHFNRKWWLLLGLITLPFFYMLWTSYTYATKTEVATVLVNSKTSYEYKKAQSVDVSFTFKEEKNDNEYELKPYIYIWVTFDNGTKYNLCELGCSNNKKEILTIVDEIKKQSGAETTVKPLRTFEEDILKKDHPEMMYLYEDLLKLSPQVSPAKAVNKITATDYYWQGFDIWVTQKDPTAAAIYYKKALAINPDFAPALSSYGFLLGAFEGNPVEGEKMIRRAMELDPDWAYAPFNLGLLLDINGDYREGINYVQYTVDTFPTHPDIEHFKEHLQAMKNHYGVN